MKKQTATVLFPGGVPVLLVTTSDIPLPVCEVVCYPCHQVLVHLHLGELLSLTEQLYGVKSTGTVIKHDPHCALQPIQVCISSVKQTDDDCRGSRQPRTRSLRCCRTSLSEVFIKCDVKATGLKSFGALGRLFHVLRSCWLSAERGGGRR